MNKAFQIILGIAVLLISLVVGVLGWQEAKKQKTKGKEDIYKKMKAVRDAKAAKSQVDLNDNNHDKKEDIKSEVRPSNG